jgi:acetyl-CoA carboxylase alpha subunit
VIAGGGVLDPARRHQRPRKPRRHKIPGQHARFGVIGQTPEGAAGGFHRDPQGMIAATGDAIAQALNDWRNLDGDGIRRQRRQKFLDIGRKLG